MGRRYRYMFSAPNDVPLFGVVGVDRDANDGTTLYRFIDSSNSIHLHTCCDCMWIELMILCFALLSFPSVNPNVISSLVNDSQGGVESNSLQIPNGAAKHHYEANSGADKCITVVAEELFNFSEPSRLRVDKVQLASDDVFPVWRIRRVEAVL